MYHPVAQAAGALWFIKNAKKTRKLLNTQGTPRILSAGAQRRRYPGMLSKVLQKCEC